MEAIHSILLFYIERKTVYITNPTKRGKNQQNDNPIVILNLFQDPFQQKTMDPLLSF